MRFSAPTGPDSAQAVKDLSNLEITLRRLGDYQELARIQERLLSSCRLTLGAADVLTLNWAFSLAFTKRILGEYERSYELDSEVVGGYTVLHGEQSSETLRARLALAMDTGTLGRFSEAREALERLADDAKVLPRRDKLRQEILQATSTLQALAQRLEGDDN